MIHFDRGNLLEADVDALVNTVNTVGVMGKGIALMMKEAFPDNYQQYAEACKRKEVAIGKMFVTQRGGLIGPRWIINFPTKRHWRDRTKLEWIEEGLQDLVRLVEDKSIRSIAVPPLGCGNGGLDWCDVRPVIVSALEELEDVQVFVYEPTKKYQNVTKRTGVEKLTPARALVAELVRRYWVLGIECSVLEIQKLAWFLERAIERLELENPVELQFKANRYGPYADRLRHLLDDLDGSYLHCDRRLSDARPTDAIWFDDTKKQLVAAFLNSGEARKYQPALQAASDLIAGFESPLGMELLATVDWLLVREGCEPTVEGIKEGIERWPGGREARIRKREMLDDRLIGLALERLAFAS